MNRVCTCVVYLFQTIGILIVKQNDPRLYDQVDLLFYVREVSNKHVFRLFQRVVRFYGFSLRKDK